MGTNSYIEKSVMEFTYKNDPIKPLGRDSYKKPRNMKTPDELKELRESVKKSKDVEWKNKEKNRRDEEKQKKKFAINKAKRDVELAIEDVESQILCGVIKKTYKLDSSIYNWSSTDPLYWNTLCKELVKLGYNAMVEKTDENVYDSLSVITYYHILVKI